MRPLFSEGRASDKNIRFKNISFAVQNDQMKNRGLDYADTVTGQSA